MDARALETMAELKKTVEQLQGKVESLKDEVNSLKSNQLLMENNMSHFLRSFEELREDITRMNQLTTESFRKFNDSIEKKIEKEMRGQVIWLEELDKKVNDFNSKDSKLVFKAKETIVTVVIGTIIVAILALIIKSGIK